MEVQFRSRANVCAVLKTLKIIQSTPFQELSDVRRDRTIRSVEYRPGPIVLGNEYVLKDLWSREKISSQTFWSPQNGTRVFPDYIPPFSVHNDVDIERTPRDKSHDYDSCTYGSIAPLTQPLTYNGQDLRKAALNGVVNATNNDSSFETPQNVVFVLKQSTSVFQFSEVVAEFWMCRHIGRNVWLIHKRVILSSLVLLMKFASGANSINRFFELHETIVCVNTGC